MSDLGRVGRRQKQQLCQRQKDLMGYWQTLWLCQERTRKFALQNRPHHWTTLTSVGKHASTLLLVVLVLVLSAPQTKDCARLFGVENAPCLRE